MKRSQFIRHTTLTAAGFLLTRHGMGRTRNEFPVVRVPAAQRKFTSTAVENVITKFKSSVSNKELGWLFENCFPNTLDTTVDFEMIDG